MATLNEKLRTVPTQRREKIEARSADLIAEEMSLRDLRRAHRLTQARLAKALKIGQDGVSRLEKRSDLLISTLRSYVEAMGGDLRLVASFPDRPEVVVSDFIGMGDKGARSSGRPGAKARRTTAWASKRHKRSHGAHP